MGFRTYIGKMSKGDAIKIKSMTKEDIARDFGDDDIDNNYPPGPYELAENIYDLGKSVILEIEHYRLFDDDELEAHYNEDYEFYGITKQGFIDIIEMYKTEIANYYKSMYSSLNIVGASHEEIENHLRGMVSEWNNDPIDLTDNPRLTASWKYEYAIFEMVRLFKTFDWDNDIAVIYGY